MTTKTAVKPSTGIDTVKSETSSISLNRIKRSTCHIEIVGTAPLIVHAWSPKAKLMMLNAQQGKKTPKTPKDPIADYFDSMYRFENDEHGFPTLGFKAATVSGGARVFGRTVRMTEMRIAMSFIADGVSTQGDQLTVLHASEPRMREDMVRIGMGTADLRYRAEYEEWGATLTIKYLPNMIDVDSIVALVDAGGLNGVGEWRPEKDGICGTYEVVGA